MEYKIVHEKDHYVVYLNGSLFIASCDTFFEAAKEIESILAEGENNK